ncbi:MAG: dihydrolipoamide acetyltransferase family protein [Acidimicrobiia bacterium]
MAEQTSSGAGAEPLAFRMPSLGADMTVGTVLDWHIGVGDVVRHGDIVALVDTEKAEIEVECWDDGTVAELVVPVGEQVPVGTVLAWLSPAGVPTGAVATPQAAPTPPAEIALTPPAGTAPARPVPVRRVEPRVLSPLVRHLAEERHLDPARLQGSGPGHQVRRIDVESAAIPSGLVDRPRVSPRARRLAAAAGIDPASLTGSGPGGAVIGRDIPSGPVGERSAAALVTAAVPVDRSVRMRRAIGELMSRSWQEIPHYHLQTRAELSAALERLARANEAQPISRRVLPAALLLHAVARAAAHHPLVNGTYTGGAFHPADRVDLGVVVALRGGGLLAPTIVGADRLSPVELMAALRDVVTRARRGRLRSADTAPASITVTNLGELGVDAVFGVIHPPQVALVGIGAVHEEPWAAGGMVAARPVVQLTLAGDHRVSDGLTGAAFLAEVVRNLQEDVAMNVEDAP